MSTDAPPTAEREGLSWALFGTAVRELAAAVAATDYQPDQRVLVVDDVADSGRTLALVLDLVRARVAQVRGAVLYEKPRSIVRPDYAWRHTDRWISFPWSALPPVTAGQDAAGQDATSGAPGQFSLGAPDWRRSRASEDE